MKINPFPLTLNDVHFQMIFKAIFFFFFISLSGYSIKSYSFDFFVDHEKLIAKVDTTHPFPGACLIYKTTHGHPPFERVIYFDENDNSIAFVILRFPNSSHKGRQYLTGYHCPEGLIATMEASPFHDKKIHDIAAYIERNLLLNGVSAGASGYRLQNLDELSNFYYCLDNKFAFILEADILFMLPNGAIFFPTGIDRYIKLHPQGSKNHVTNLEGNILGYDLCSSLSEEQLYEFHKKYNKATTSLSSTCNQLKDRKKEEDQLLRVVITALNSEKKTMALMKRMPYLTNRWPTRLIQEVVCDYPELIKEFHTQRTGNKKKHRVTIHGKDDDNHFSISKITLKEI